VKKRIAAVLVACMVVAFVATSVTYVHRGYIGVVESGGSLRLLQHGPHLKAPGQRATFYPVRYQQVHLRVSDEGLRGRVELDMILLVSVSPDSIASLHETYRGGYIESLVSPLIVEFLRQRGDGSRDWTDGIGSEKEAAKIIEHLNSTAAPHGINVLRGWIRSYEVVTNRDVDSMSLGR
jgi:regulator of protease activity HflC (stomatin/prohibitin superfamily)